MPLTLRAPARISLPQFTRVLERYGSPCAPIARECYDIIVAAGLDPAVALAFFGRESVFGTRGISAETKNWGNVRTPFNPARASGTHPRNFAIYPSWQESLRDWCDRINVRYINERGLDTVEKAVPVYAPSFDGNVPQAYVEHVVKLVAQWVQEDSQTAPQPAHTPVSNTTGLRDELLRFTYASAGTTYRSESPLHRYALKELRAGRPLGNPLSDLKQITVGGQAYVVQVYALDTLYSPVARPGDVYRLSELLKKDTAV